MIAIATTVNTGLRRSIRMAKRRSWAKVSSTLSLLVVAKGIVRGGDPRSYGGAVCGFQLAAAGS
jgi:hypothetical protein